MPASTPTQDGETGALVRMILLQVCDETGQTFPEGKLSSERTVSLPKSHNKSAGDRDSKPGFLSPGPGSVSELLMLTGQARQVRAAWMRDE